MNVKVEGLSLNDINNTISIVVGRREYTKIKLDKYTSARDELLDKVETLQLKLMDLADNIKGAFNPKIQSLQEQLNEFAFVTKVIEGFTSDNKESLEEDIIQFTANDRKHLQLIEELAENVSNAFVKTVNGKAPEKKPGPHKPAGVTNGLIRKPNGITIVRTVVKDYDIPDKIDVMPERTPMMQFRPEQYMSIQTGGKNPGKPCANNKFIAGVTLRFIEDRGGATAAEIKQWLAHSFPELHVSEREKEKNAWGSYEKGFQNLKQNYLDKDPRFGFSDGAYRVG